MDELAKVIEKALSHCCMCDDCEFKDIVDMDECKSKRIAKEILKHYQPKLEAKVMVFHSQHGKSDKYWCGHCRAHLGYVNNPTYTDPPNYCFYCGAKLTEVCDE